MSSSSRQESGECLWVLNPDAEVELAAAGLGRAEGYQTGAALFSEMKKRASAFLDLTREEPVCFAYELLQSPSVAKAHAGRRALLWAPTPMALRAAKNLRVSAAPSLGVQRAVHHKGFLSEAELPVLPGRTAIYRYEQLKRELEKCTPQVDAEGTVRQLRLKRGFGFAGRGQRAVGPPLSEDDERWIKASLALGPLYLEPEIRQPDLYSIHGVVLASTLLLGSLIETKSDRFGAPTRLPERGPESSEFLARELQEEAQDLAQRAAHCLRARGYFGPFGLDLLRSATGKTRAGTRLAALDLNPRFSLHFSRGMGPRREEALEMLRSLIPD